MNVLPPERRDVGKGHDLLCSANLVPTAITSQIKSPTRLVGNIFLVDNEPSEVYVRAQALCAMEC